MYELIVCSWRILSHLIQFRTMANGCCVSHKTHDVDRTLQALVTTTVAETLVLLQLLYNMCSTPRNVDCRNEMLSQGGQNAVFPMLFLATTHRS